MAFHPKILADAKARGALPAKFVPSERFHALIAGLNAIEEPAGEARDKAIHYALIDVGLTAPEAWRELYK